jgi:hypothetical protein
LRSDLRQIPPEFHTPRTSFDPIRKKSRGVKSGQGDAFPAVGYVAKKITLDLLYIS